jgi:DNA-binding GntR family transcriptional regulator
VILSGAVEFMSKRSLVEDAIRRAIHVGRFTPGQKLNLDEVARTLKVSRTPVREAFRALELQGYLRVEPSVGTIVLGLEPQEVNEIYTIRINLEGLATRLAVSAIDGECLRILEGFLSDITALDPAQSEYARIDALNRSFHFGIYEKSGNQRLLGMIHSLWDSVVRYRAQNTRITGFMARSTKDHKAILQEIQDGHAAQAEALMQDHLEMSRRALLEQIVGPEARR